MAAVTWYVTSSLASVHQDMSETSPGAEGYATPATGWVVGTGATNYKQLQAQTEAGSFDATVHPDGTLITSAPGDCFRSTNTYTGTFDTGNWTIDLAVRAQTGGGTHDGNAGFRVFSGAAADGSDAVERTSARQEGSTVTDLATSATQKSSATFSVDTFSVTNEYIFIQVGWERTGAGDNANRDVNIRVGTGATVVTSANFTAGGGGGSASLNLLLLGCG
jgi:hypothetical protein